MISLFPLRPIQIVDISFQLLRKKFLKTFFIAFLVTLPFQILVWLLTISQPQETGLTARIAILITIIQFLAIGMSLTLTSNIMSVSTGKTYCETIFNNVFTVKPSHSRIFVALYQVVVQLIFALSLVGIRLAFGQMMPTDAADVLAWFIVILALGPWIIVTLRYGFAIPISVHEGGTFRQIRKRTRQLNKVHFWKLFGVYWITVFMIFVLILPTLFFIQIIIANKFITSDVGSSALLHLIFASVIAFVACVYAHILTVTYFNARIEKEGLDISVSLSQLENERSDRGKLFNSVA